MEYLPAFSISIRFLEKEKSAVKNRAFKKGVEKNEEVIYINTYTQRKNYHLIAEVHKLHFYCKYRISF